MAVAQAAQQASQVHPQRYDPEAIQRARHAEFYYGDIDVDEEAERTMALADSETNAAEAQAAALPDAQLPVPDVKIGTFNPQSNNMQIHLHLSVRMPTLAGLAERQAFPNGWPVRIPAPSVMVIHVRGKYRVAFALPCQTHANHHKASISWDSSRARLSLMLRVVKPTAAKTTPRVLARAQAQAVRDNDEGSLTVQVSNLQVRPFLSSCPHRATSCRTSFLCPSQMSATR
jgi:hypothetical protein